MGLRMEAADEIRSSERELMTGSGACRAKVHACRALAFRTRMTFMRRRGPGELPYNSRQSARSCLAGRLMSDLGQRLSPAFQPALPYRRVDARVTRFLLTAHHSRLLRRTEQTCPYAGTHNRHHSGWLHQMRGL